MAGKTQGKQLAIKASKFDISKFSVKITAEDIAKQDANPKMAKMPHYGYPRYKYTTRNDNGEVIEIESQLVMTTDDIKMVSGGVPTNPAEGKKFYETEQKRALFRIAIDSKQQACVDFGKAIKDIDEFMMEHKNEILSVFAKDKKTLDSYNYSPLYNQVTEEQPTNSKYPKYDSVKMRLDTNFETSEIKTALYVRQPTGKPERIDAKTLIEFEKYLKWNCVYQCGIIVSNIWVGRNKTGVGKSASYLYGVRVKCAQIAVKELSSVKQQQSINSDYMFGDDVCVIDEKKSSNKVCKVSNDSDDDTPTPAVAKKVITKKSVSVSDDEEDVDDEDEDESTPVVTKKVSTKKSVSVSDDEDEDEDDDDDDALPKKNGVAPKRNSPKNSKYSDDDDD